MTGLVENKKARLNFEILETVEAGIELLGFEVKSLRLGRGTLEGAHITVRGAEAYLIGMHIPPYQVNNTPRGYDPMRHRRLLLLKRELSVLASLESQKGLTIVPIMVYNKGKNLKVRLAVARGKKKFDKRETLKKRDASRHIERTLKNQ
jgi:SsrA-binding protein